MSLRGLTLALIAGLWATTAAAQTASGLIRLGDRDDLLGWEAVGRLDHASGGFCTGTLIAPDLVLTAAHCVYGPDRRSMAAPSSLTFRAGFSHGSAIAERRVARIAVPPEYQPGPRATTARARHDVALLELEQPIPVSEVDPFALHSGETKGLPVSVVSYGKGRAEALSRQRSCNMLYRNQALLVFDCDVTFGSSGSPVFVKTGNRVRILSVVSQMARTGDGKVALGMELPALVDSLKATLRATRQAPQASLRRITVGGDRSGTGAQFVKP